MSVDLVKRLIEAGTPAHLVAEVAMALGTAEAERKALADRRSADKERKARQRSKENLSRDVTGHHGKSQENTPSQVPPNDNNSNPPPTSPSSDPDGSAQPVGSAPSEVSVNDQIWNSKAALADLSGKSEESVGRWIGKALKDHPPDVVKQGIDAALHAGTRDPFSYARSVMLNSQGPANAQQGTRNGRTNPGPRSQGTAARVASLMGYDPEPDLHGSEEERRIPDRPSWSKGRDTAGFFDAELDATGVYRTQGH